jgi:hypothetical protein
VAADIDNVRVGVTGAFYTAPVGTAFPSAFAAPGGSWVELGWIGEDGVTESYSDDVTELRAWQNATVLRTLITGTTNTVATTLVETNETVLEVFHKTTVTSSGVVPIVGGGTDPRAFVLDVIDGDEQIRLLIARGEVTTRGDLTYSSGALVGYPITVSMEPVNQPDWEARGVDTGDFAVDGQAAAFKLATVLTGS